MAHVPGVRPALVALGQGIPLADRQLSVIEVHRELRLLKTVGEFLLSLVPCAAIFVVGVPIAVLVHRLNRRCIARGKEDVPEGLMVRGMPPSHHEPLDDIGDLVSFFGDVDDDR